MIEEIRSKKGNVIAIILKRHAYPEKTTFYTPSAFSQQLGLLNHKKGGKIRPHMHIPISRHVEITQEVLHIKKGKLKILLYDEDRNYMEDRMLEEGDTVLLAAGGHGFEILEDSIILEVKQGPYTDESEKEYFA
ncbi:MAG: WbuC family cupin fold metalloprotein [Candidatus Omnitrophota bacterium]